MVTYCVGSARQKRAYFASASGVVVLDNVEVLFCASADGKNYFALGEVPFGSFGVLEYLKYRRALCDKKVNASQIRALGLSPRKRLKRLCAAEMRLVMFLEKTAGETDKAIVVNLDGCKYTRRNAAALKRLTALADEVYVCVTDERFIPSGARIMRFGKRVKRARRPMFYAARRLSRILGAKRVEVV